MRLRQIRLAILRHAPVKKRCLAPRPNAVGNATKGRRKHKPDLPSRTAQCKAARTRVRTHRSTQAASKLTAHKPDAALPNANCLKRGQPRTWSCRRPPVVAQRRGIPDSSGVRRAPLPPALPSGMSDAKQHDTPIQHSLRLQGRSAGVG